MQSKKYLYRFYLFLAIIVMTFIVYNIYVQRINNKFPECIYVNSRSDAVIEMGLPVTGYIESDTENIIDFNNKVTIKAGEPGRYNIKLKLFDLIEINDLEINVVDESYVYPGGFQVGLYLKSNGVIVVNTETVTTANGNRINPCEERIYKGDYIISMNGKNITSKKEISEIMKNNNGEEITFSIIRNNQEMEVKVTPAFDSSGVYRIGLWIKDDAQGIGTISYIKDDGTFAALGHGITDNATGQIMNISKGALYKTRILSVVKGKNGEPGELQGVIEYKNENIIGTIEDNNSHGIFGQINRKLIDEYALENMEVGYGHSVKKEKAYIRLYTDKEYTDYEINIITLSNGSSKNICFEVTSDELIEKTNGIVQGMSGCPIIQNNKMIGVVTHVCIDDCKRGYGIYVEKMLAQ
ncbi:MAG: SpoIVB peptidase [Eubacteriales bacterium]|nr:SpoIVB peptidase [Eubacteriales bacterium]